MSYLGEHALLIVKPDDVWHPRFTGILDKRLAELSLRQVATRELLLSRDRRARSGGKAMSRSTSRTSAKDPHGRSSSGEGRQPDSAGFSNPI